MLSVDTSLPQFLIALRFISPVSFQMMQVGRCPTDELSLTNCAVINEKETQIEQ